MIRPIAQLLDRAQLRDPHQSVFGPEGGPTCGWGRPSFDEQPERKSDDAIHAARLSPRIVQSRSRRSAEMKETLSSAVLTEPALDFFMTMLCDVYHLCGLCVDRRGFRGSCAVGLKMM